MLKSLFSFGCLVQLCFGSSIDSVERSLYEYLFTNYSSDIRPVAGDIDYRIPVAVRFRVGQIEALNEKDQVLTTHGTIALRWTDQLLVWNPAHYGNLRSLIVPSSKVWLPELTPGNSVIDAGELAFDESLRVHVYSTGVVLWTPNMRWRTSCEIDVSMFPYDEQECNIVYGSEVYTNTLLNYTVEEQVLTTDVIANAGWNLTEASASLSVLTNAFNSKPIIQLHIKLTRNSRYFELNIILPAVLLSLLLIPMFMLPVDSGEKVSLGITLMLAYSIFLLVLTEYTPQSGTIPNLSVVMLLCVVFSGVGLFVNVVIINIHHHLPEKPVPGWVKRIILGVVGSTICRMKYKQPDTSSKVDPQVTDQDLVDGIQKLPLAKNVSPGDMEQLLAYLKFFKTKRLDDDQTEQVKEDWNKVARVLDRIFLIVYILLFVVFLFVTLSYKWNAN